MKNQNGVSLGEVNINYKNNCLKEKVMLALLGAYSYTQAIQYFQLYQ